MLSELTLSINNDISALDEMLEKANIMFEYEYNKYVIESCQNELDAIMEASDEEPLPGKASDGLVGKAAKLTAKVFASLVNAIRSIFAKIRKAFDDVKFKMMLSKAEKAAKENSKLKNKTVEVYDPSHELKVIAKYKDFLNKEKAKVKAGKTDGVVEEVDAESESYNKKLKAAKVAATVTVTLAAAIAMVKVYSNKFGTNTEASLVKDAEVKENFEGKSPEFANAVVKIQNEMSKAIKDEASAMSKAVTEALSSIKSGISNTTEIKTNETAAKDIVKNAMESTDNNIDIESLTESIINEAEVNLSLDNTGELMDTFESTVATVFDDDNFDPEKFLELYEESKIEDNDEEEVDIDSFLESYEVDDSIAEYLVENALNN